MKLSLFDSSASQEVTELFKQVFSASEGELEGQNIAELVSSLIAKTASQDLIGCVASENGLIVGCVFFSRFAVSNNQVAFILSPVAVSTDVQGIGIGQQLINHGIDYLRSLNVDLIFTYGAPAYYSKTGFEQISEDIVRAPFRLSQPIGWLAQSLDGAPMQPITGTTECVEALSDPKYW